MLPVQLGIGATTQQTCLLSSVCNHGCLEHLLCWLQYCGAEQQNSQDAGTGAVVKCLVANNQSLTTSCLGEVQRLAASALLLYQPVSHPSVPKPIEDTFKGQLRTMPAVLSWDHLSPVFLLLLCLLVHVDLCPMHSVY